jgi:hypothetical protein
MQKFAVKGRELTLLGQTILTKNDARILYRTAFVLFSLFAAYFAIQICLHLPDHLFTLTVYLLLFIASVLSIQKIITDRCIANRCDIPFKDLRVVRFKRRLIKCFAKPIPFSAYPHAEFEAKDGTVTKFRVLLEKPVLSQFKFELVKRDVRIEE